jgi:hypothetical protein
MFRAAIAGLCLSVPLGFLIGATHPPYGFERWMLLVMVPCALLIGAALLRWGRYPEGIRDTWSGGSITLTRNDAQVLEWSDWSLWQTNAGRINRVTNMVRVQTRLLMGLIPISTVNKSTREFNQVLLDEKEKLGTVLQEHADDEDDAPTYARLTLVLTSAAGDRLELLDLNTRLGDSNERDFMRELERLIRRAVGHP